jgi:hypothetical protein
MQNIQPTDLLCRNSALTILIDFSADEIALLELSLSSSPGIIFDIRPYCIFNELCILSGDIHLDENCDIRVGATA